MRSKRQYKPEFGSWLRRERIRRGLNQVELAVKLGVSASTLSQMEQGIVPERIKLEAMLEHGGEDPQPWLQAAGYQQTSDTAEVREGGLAEEPPDLREVAVYGVVNDLGIITGPQEDKEVVTRTAVVGTTVLLVTTDSLGPAFRRGDRLMVEEGTSARPGQLVVAEVQDGTRRLARVGRLPKSEDRREGLALIAPTITDVSRSEWVAGARVVAIVHDLYRPKA